MNSEKCEIVAAADAMKLGELRAFSPVLLKVAFHDRLALDGTPHDTPESAFLASLIGGMEGHYTLREDRRRYGYILSRAGQPFWQQH